MMDDRKVIAFIQARMGSTRFPGKVLQKIKEVESKPHTLLDMVVNRLGWSRLIDVIVVATSDNPADDFIAECCLEQGYKCIRGDEENVMGRILKASGLFSPYEIIVDVTADCPFVDPSHIDDMIDLLKKDKLDYVSNVMERTWPDGLDAQVYTQNALHTLAQYFPVNVEHVGYNFVTNCDGFKCRNVPAPEKYRHPEWELTVDYPADLELVRILDFIAQYGSEGFCRYAYRVERVLDVLLRFPGLLNINRGLARKRESNAAAESFSVEKRIGLGLSTT